MLKKLRITVEGKAYDVTVEDLTENGHAAHHPVAANPAPVVPSAAPQAPPPPPNPAAASGPGDLVSPLTGVVDQVLAGIGQKVAAGDTVVVVEAMKMKTAVAADRAGTITAVAVKAGDAVDAGHVLLTIG